MDLVDIKRKKKGRKIVSPVVHVVILSLTFHNYIQVFRTSIFLTWQHNETCLNIPRPTKLHCSVTFCVLTCVSKHGQTVLYYSLYFTYAYKLYKIQHICSSLVFLSTCSALFLYCL